MTCPILPLFAYHCGILAERSTTRLLASRKWAVLNSGSRFSNPSPLRRDNAGLAYPVCQMPKRRMASCTADRTRQCGLGVPNLPAAKAENLASCTASSATQCRLNPVSGRNLPKTGVFQLSAGDHRLFRSENAQNRGPETGGQFAKARHWQAFLPISGTFSPGAGLSWLATQC
jgi:hypothetical protein